MKKKMLSEDCIPGFSKVLLFICQPCLAVFTFGQLEFSWKLFGDLGIFAALIILVHALMLGDSFLVYPEHLTREMTGMSLPRIGDAFGRDHSTIINSCEKVTKLMEEGGEMKAIIADLKKIISEK